MIVRVLFLIGLLSGCVSALAQSSPHQVDSLKNQVRQYVKKDSVRINLLVTLADALATAAPDDAMRYADNALQLAEEIRSPMGLAVSYRQKAVIYYLLTDYSRAIDYNYKALKAAANLKKNNKGSTLFAAVIQNNLGTIYMSMHQYDRAIANFTHYLDVVKKMNEPTLRREESMALLNIGVTYSYMKAYRQALAFTDRSLAIAEADKDYQVAAYNLATQGVVYTSLKKPQLAVGVYTKGVLYADRAGDLSIKSRCLGGLADTCFDLEQYSKSETYAKQAYTLAKELHALELQREVTQLLAYVYIAQKKSQQATTYLETSLALRDSILNDDKKMEIARREERFGQEKREAILSARHTAELKQQQTERNTVAGGAGGLILAAGLGFMLYKRKRDADEQARTARFDTLVAETRLKALRSQINPHFIANALSAIGNYVLRNDALSADRYLTKFAHLMRSILTNSELKVVPLADDMETLESYMQLENLRFNYPFTYRIDIDPALDQQRTLIPPLLFQPFVENSIWHGLAPQNKPGGQIVVRIRQADTMLLCTITDNGIGREKSIQIRPAQPGRQSHGISITRDRIEIINHQQHTNGYVTLSDLTEGTEVAVGLPLVLA